MPTFSVVTFGCQMNQHDSSRMEEVLSGAGYTMAEEAEQADVILLNTCSIREKAEQKLRSEVGRLSLLKRERPDLVIAVAGCLAQQEGERLLKRLPQIDLILGPDNIPELPRLLGDLETGGLPQVRTVFDLEAPSFLLASPTPGRLGASAFVTVMKGCNERCSYCIVPHTRGPERYRASGEIIVEMQRLVDAGVREVTLLGQTVNSYRDPSGVLGPPEEASRFKKLRGAESRADETQFPVLLRAISEQVKGLARLRYTSPHPRHLTSSLIRAHAELPILCRHVHLPVQSGSDAVLRRMIRRYSAAEYLERTQALVEEVPGLTLSTDVIVGFPSESDADFEATLDLVRKVGFVSLFGFKYSQRPFTPAQKLGDDISEAEKGRRLALLFEAVEVHKQKHLASLVGREEEVLIEGISKHSARAAEEATTPAPVQVTGRTHRNEIVHIERSDEALVPGAFAKVRLTTAFKNSLLGELLEVTESAPEPLLRQAQQQGLPVPQKTRLATSDRRALPLLPG